MLPVYSYSYVYIFLPRAYKAGMPVHFWGGIQISVTVFEIHRSETLSPGRRSPDNLRQRRSTEYFCIFSHCLEKSYLTGALARSFNTMPPVPLSVCRHPGQTFLISMIWTGSLHFYRKGVLQMVYEYIVSTP